MGVFRAARAVGIAAAGLLLVACGGSAAQVRRGDELRRERHYDQAIAQLIAVIAEEPENAEAHVTLAHVYLETGRNDEAERALAQALRAHDSARGRYLLVQVRLRQKQWPEAQKLIAELVTAEPDNAAYWLTQGQVAAGAGELETAAKSFRRTLELSPADANTTLELATVLRRLRRYDDAVAVLTTALRVKSTLGLQLALGGVYEDMRLPDYARFAYDKALKHDPSSMPAAAGLARVLRAAGKTDEAMMLLMAETQEHPGEAALFYELGALHTEFAMRVDAAKAFGKAVALEPKNHTYQRALVAALDPNQDASPAQLKLLEHAAAILTEDFELQLRLGNAALKRKEWPLSVQAFAAAVALQHTEARGYVGLAQAHLGAGAFADAQRTIDELAIYDAFKADELRRRLDTVAKPVESRKPPNKKGKRAKK